MDETPATRPTPSLDRREVLALGVGVFVAASIPLAARAPQRTFRRRIPVMGTIAEITVVHDDANRVREATDAAFEALRAVDRQMSRFRRDSEVGRINRLAVSRTVHVGPETASVLARARDWARDTDGRFDPCLGRAAALWDVTRRTAPPAQERVAALAGRGLWQALDLDVTRRGAAVRLRDRAAAVDLGGIAKGHGVDRAVAALRMHGIEHGIVNVGGDLYALGQRPDGSAWRVGVRDASDPTRIARTLELSDAAVATSGDYQQFFDFGGRRYHHLLDPRTGAPIQAQVHSATAERRTCIEADAAATALFAQGAPS